MIITRFEMTSSMRTVARGGLEAAKDLKLISEAGHL